MRVHAVPLSIAIVHKIPTDLGLVGAVITRRRGEGYRYAADGERDPIFWAVEQQGIVDGGGIKVPGGERKGCSEGHPLPIITCGGLWGAARR